MRFPCTAKCDLMLSCLKIKGWRGIFFPTSVFITLTLFSLPVSLGFRFLQQIQSVLLLENLRKGTANGRYVPSFLSLLPPHSFLKRNALSICFLLFKPRLLFLMLSLAILATLFVQKEINHFIFKSHKLLLPFCQEDWSLSRLRNNTQICQVLSNVTFL